MLSDFGRSRFAPTRARRVRLRSSRERDPSWPTRETKETRPRFFETRRETCRWGAGSTRPGRRRSWTTRREHIRRVSPNLAHPSDARASRECLARAHPLCAFAAHSFGGRFPLQVALLPDDLDSVELWRGSSAHGARTRRLSLSSETCIFVPCFFFDTNLSLSATFQTHTPLSLAGASGWSVARVGLGQD